MNPGTAADQTNRMTTTRQTTRRDPRLPRKMLALAGLVLAVAAAVSVLAAVTPADPNPAAIGRPAAAGDSTLPYDPDVPLDQLPLHAAEPEPPPEPEVYINDEAVSIPPNGIVHRELITEDGVATIDIESRRDSDARDGDTSSSMRVEIHSESGTDSGETPERRTD